MGQTSAERLRRQRTDRPNPLKTTIAYNANGTISTRIDHAISATASVFTYDTLGRLRTATNPLSGSVTASYTWRLDGLMAGRSWSSGPAAIAYGYDGAKRAISECNGTSGSCSDATIRIERTFDRAGNVTSESQTIAGAHASRNGVQSFAYDGLNRVTGSSLNAVVMAYTYDADGNRLTVAKGGTVTDTFTFDRNDQTESNNGTNFTYDRYGNLLSSWTSAASSTTYAFDLADRMVSITQASGNSVGFTFDAAGRHATRTATPAGGSTTTLDTYDYLGTTNSVIRDVSSLGAGSSVDAAIDSMGTRLASKTASGYLAWVIPDLHGNVVAQCSSTGTISDVLRYDAESVASA
jgi:YD repeat-containing protein